MARYAERIGTANADLLAGAAQTVTFGLAGNDIFSAQSTLGDIILIGGSGADTYRSMPSTSLLIADNGSSAGDTLITSTLAPSTDTITATIDNRLFFAENRSSGETVLIIDFLSTKNYIERISTPDGVYSTADLFNFARSQPSFQGNFTWEQLRSAGEPGLPTTNEFNETFSFYSFRAAALEAPLPNGDAGSIYRFFNTKTGTHFYTSSLSERNTIATTIPEFKYEGNAFDSDATAANGVPVFRFYNATTGVHFYTASAAERDQVQASGSAFQYEGEAYKAYATDAPGRLELYRFYNTETGTHFYTASDAEQQQIIQTLPSYRYEGVAYYVDAA